MREEEGTSFEIEKIPGITVSQLFVDELLQENTLIHVLRSLVRIHNCENCVVKLMELMELMKLIFMRIIQIN